MLKLLYSTVRSPFTLHPPTSPRTPHQAKLSDPVIVQYTSGSTGDPKGIVMSNANLVHQLRCPRERCLPVARRILGVGLRYKWWLILIPTGCSFLNHCLILRLSDLCRNTPLENPAGVKHRAGVVEFIWLTPSQVAEAAFNQQQRGGQEGWKPLNRNQTPIPYIFNAQSWTLHVTTYRETIQPETYSMTPKPGTMNSKPSIRHPPPQAPNHGPQL